MSQRNLSTLTIESPLGSLEIHFDSDFVYEVRWIREKKTTASVIRYSHHESLAEEIIRQFNGYWKGSLFYFNLPLNISEAPPFYRQVWSALCDIPYGNTVSYRDIARKVGKPEAARAVGNACAANPFAVVIPCHRVVKSDGSLGKYSATGGTELKKKLILFEKRHLPKKHSI